jgi:UrcA family protein
MKSRYAISAALGALLAAQSASAETAAITYDDLDLSSAEGKAELDRRVDRAARDICGYSELMVGSRIIPAEARKCYKDALKQIKKTVAAVTSKKAAGG